MARAILVLVNLKFDYVLRNSVAYPELVSRGVSKSRKFKWLVKVGACKDVNPLIKKKLWPGGGGFPGNQKTPLDMPLKLTKFLDNCCRVKYTMSNCCFLGQLDVADDGWCRD